MRAGFRAEWPEIRCKATANLMFREPDGSIFGLARENRPSPQPSPGAGEGDIRSAQPPVTLMWRDTAGV